MGLRRPTRCLTAWIACFAILFASLAPSISHAVTVARNSTSFWVEDGSRHGEAHKAADHQDHQDLGARLTIRRMTRKGRILSTARFA